MKFMYKGEWIKLQGIQKSKPSLQEISSEQLLKWAVGNDIWSFAIVAMDAPHQEEDSVPEEIQAVIQEYKDVFAEPKGLPPERVHDHPIPTIPGVVPVNSKPYRSPPLHKDEIEKQVKDLLAVGLIVPSTSPYASPVLLVQKKDGSWRFCVDYRRLNEIY